MIRIKTKIDQRIDHSNPWTMKKRILLILLPSPWWPNSYNPTAAPTTDVPTNDMLVMTQAPDEIKTLVTGACYDCHSYPVTMPSFMDTPNSRRSSERSSPDGSM
jgi:hypothetical protein